MQIRGTFPQAYGDWRQRSAPAPTGEQSMSGKRMYETGAQYRARLKAEAEAAEAEAERQREEEKALAWTGLLHVDFWRPWRSSWQRSPRFA